MTWEEAVAVALALPGTEMSSSYGQPAVRANGNAFLNVGHEASISFCLRIDIGLKQAMIDRFPATFFETPHYANYSAVLVRYDGPDEATVRDMIDSAYRRACAKKSPRPRKQ